MAMPTLRPGPLQWAVSGYCVILGTLMLITPHQFASRTFLPLQPALPWWGAGFLYAGGLLLAVAVLRPRRGLTLLAHSAAGASLLVLAYAFGLNGAWTGTTNYLTLGLGTLLAPLLSRPGRPSAGGRDLFTLLMALAGALTGAAILLLPAQFRAQSYDPLRPLFPLHGLAFLLGGLALLAVAARRPDDRPALRAAHLLAGAAYLAFCLTFAIPNRGMPAIVLYGGLGTLLTALPWIAPRLQRIDPAGLQTRLTLGLVGLAAVPLILGVALATAQEERVATELALTRQQSLARALAESAATYVEQHRDAVVALAGELTAAGPAPERQRALLERFQRAYDRVDVFNSYDAEGRPVARGDGRPLGPPVSGGTILTAARQTLAPTLVISTAPVLRLPVVAVGAPILDAQGQFAGLVVGAFDTARLAEKAEQAATLSVGEIYLVDERGRVIAHPDLSIAASFADRSGALPVIAQQRSGRSGSVIYLAQDGLRLVGYAPVADLGWGVIVDRPAAAVLAGVRAGRELTLGLLVLVLAVAVPVSVAVARALSVPLALLVDATRQIAAGGGAAPLPHSQIGEVAALAASVGRLRDSLAARTDERDRAEQHLRLLADAGSSLAASLDPDTTLERVMGLVVPTLGDWGGIYLRQEDGQVALAAVAHADPARLAVARALLSRHPVETDVPGGVARVLRSGQPELIDGMGDEQLAALAGDEEQLRLLRALGVRGLMVVPLRARGQTIGALVLASSDAGPQCGREDLALAEELARRAALALDNARLYVAERRARAEAETAVRVREQFLSIAAHELKTPLTPLLGQAQLMQRRAQREGLLSERDLRSLRVITSQASRLDQLISSMLDLNRLQTGRLSLRLAPLDLRELVLQLAEELQLTFELHRVEIDVPAGPVVVNGDALRLGQVLQNLLQNAVKYSPAGGPISVRLHEQEGLARLCVRDEGIGIPAEELPRLFEPFYRAANTAHSVVPGMGVGLAVVKEIVTLHGGSVAATSVEGQGSEFIVSLPCVEGLRDLRLEPRQLPEPTGAGQETVG